jgi:hypothetical protein
LGTNLAKFLNYKLLKKKVVIPNDDDDNGHTGVEGLSGFSTVKCPVVAVFCCPRARGKRAWKRETVTVKSCQQAQSTSIT